MFLSISRRMQTLPDPCRIMVLSSFDLAGDSKYRNFSQKPDRLVEPSQPNCDKDYLNRDGNMEDDSGSKRSPSQPSPAIKTPWSPPNGIFCTYSMHCRCGTIRWGMKPSPPLFEEETQGKKRKDVWQWNADAPIARENGYWGVHPLAKDVIFTHGLANRAEYLCGNKSCPHLFFKSCGCTIGTDLKRVCRKTYSQEWNRGLQSVFLTHHDTLSCLPDDRSRCEC